MYIVSLVILCSFTFTLKPGKSIQYSDLLLVRSSLQYGVTHCIHNLPCPQANRSFSIVKDKSDIAPIVMSNAITLRAVTMEDAGEYNCTAVLQPNNDKRRHASTNIIVFSKCSEMRVTFLTMPIVFFIIIIIILQFCFF